MKRLFKSFVIGTLALTMVGCGSPAKLELDSDNEYFNSSEKETLEIVEKYISKEFNPELIVNEANTPIIELKPYETNDESFCLITASENAIRKTNSVNVTSIIRYDSSEKPDFNELEEKYILQLGTEILSSIDMSNPQETMEKAYLDFTKNYRSSGVYENDEIYILVASDHMPDSQLVSVLINIMPSNSDYLGNRKKYS